MRKVIILENCSGCYFCEWIGGKPRCVAEEVKKVEYEGQYDWSPYQRCPSEGFLEGCPLEDYKEQ